jgi:hypothetical protein
MNFYLDIMHLRHEPPVINDLFLTFNLGVVKIGNTDTNV